MRILVTVPWGECLGGAEALLQTVLDGARDSGHELELVFLEDGPWPQEIARSGLRVEVIRSGRLHQLHRWGSTVVRLARLFRRRRPDVILNWSAKTHLYGSPAASLVGMADRVVWWQHSIPDGGWLDRLATRLPAAAIGCCSRAASQAQSRLRPSRQILLVKAGTAGPPAAEAACAPLELSGARPVVGMVGRLEPWKGQDRLLQAQALLRDRGIELQLVLVGGDAYGLSADYAASLPPLVRSLDLEDAALLTGQVSDAGPYMQQMDILVNASDPEPFGLVLLEAMARGVAVVAVDSGGPAEFIEDRRSGVLARSGEPGDLADALEPLLRSHELRDAVAVAGRERFLQEFDDVAMRRRLFAALDGAVASRAGAREVTIVAHDIGAVGGMERQLAELIGGLRARGHELTVIARTCEMPTDEGVHFHRVPGPSRPFLIAYPWFMLVGSLAVRRWRRGVVQATGAIVTNHVDVIAVHCCHQAYQAMPGRPTRLFRLYGAIVGAVKRLSERWCVRRNRSATLVCVSDGVAEEMREHYPAASQRVTTIHNGVDTEAFAPGVRGAEALALRARLGIPEEHLVVAFVGGDWEHKGLRRAIEALVDAPAWELLVAGRGHTPPYAELADSLAVGGRVHWLGIVEDVQIVYGLADAFVLPSSYETFSLVTFEAAASGLPIIATPVNGVRELIEDGHSGLLMDGSAASITECLRRLGADPALRSRLGASARAAALEFGWQRMIARHSELYESLRRAARS